MGNTVLVLDVSNNDSITEVELKTSGAKALICKATEGTWFTDGTYAKHRAIAEALEIPFGAYVFFHPGAKGEEAEFFLQHAKPHKGDIQPIIDTEVTDGESMAAVAARVDAGAKVLEAAGYKPLLYGSTSFLQNLFIEDRKLRRLRVWEADYPGHPTRWFPWIAKCRMKFGYGVSVVLWQWTDSFAIGARKFDCSRLFTKLPKICVA